MNNTETKTNVSIMVLPGLMSPDEIASEIWDISPSLLTVKTRKREVVEARQVLMLYRHTVLGMTLAKSGEPYGKEHSTVNHASKTVANLLETDSVFREKYNLFHKRVVVSF